MIDAGKMTLRGMRILVLEGRSPGSLAQPLIEAGGEVVAAPALQAIPLSKHPEVEPLAQRLISGEIRELIFMTGTGARLFIESLLHVPSPDRAAALRRAVLVARGPKTVAALREAGFEPAVIVPEPCTWREVLSAVESGERGLDLKGAGVAVIESGQGHPALAEALKKRGARVYPVTLYRWGLPDDVAPLQRAAADLREGRFDAVVFTNPAQAEHLLRVAAYEGGEETLIERLKRTVVASIGPYTTEQLRRRGIAVDWEAGASRIPALAAELSARLPELRRAKLEPLAVFSQRFPAQLPNAREMRRDSAFMRACRRQPSPHTPVWLMRQAGRYMAEYRAVRSRHSFIDMCKQPELAAEVTLTAVNRIKADAAIIFSDILLLVEPLGFGLTYEGTGGPVIEGDLRLAEIGALPEVDPRESLAFAYEAIRLTRGALDPGVPLLGFAAAPFTLAAYLIEGGASKQFIRTKQMMYAEEEAWGTLLSKLARLIAAHLRAQIEAGADAVQVFDSWVGALSRADYRRYVLPYSKQVFDLLPKDVPAIHFGTGTSTFLEDMRDAGGDVIGLDWHIDLDEGWRRLGPGVGVQGNLDPVTLFAAPKVLEREARRILDQAAGRPGHIFNLGHGVLPGTPVESVVRLIEMVHQLSATSDGQLRSDT